MKKTAFNLKTFISISIFTLLIFTPLISSPPAEDKEEEKEFEMDIDDLILPFGVVMDSTNYQFSTIISNDSI